MYDYLFRGAMVYDGSGNNPFRANVATSGGKISYIGTKNVKAGILIDSAPYILMPGVIDTHAHSEYYALKYPSMPDKLLQGITTDLSGNCGIGAYPVKEGFDEILTPLNREVLGEAKLEWDDFSTFKGKLMARGVGINMMFLQAHAPLRVVAMGKDCQRQARSKEIELMCHYLDQSLSQGCKGFSTGLYYAPCSFASRDELIALLKVVKKHDAIFAVHHRCEGDEVVESVKEVLDLAREAGVKLEISHLKLIGKDNQSKADELLSLIDDYSSSLDVMFDQYPYTYGSTSLFSLLPPEANKLSRLELSFALNLDTERRKYAYQMKYPKGWDSIWHLVGEEKIRILELDSNPDFEGLSLKEAGEKMGKSALEALFDLLAQEEGAALMTDETESEETLEKILASSKMCFGTDALYTTGASHPRSKSAVLHLIKRYALEKKLLPLECIIRKMTSEPAKRLGLNDRGMIKEGYAADLLLLDLANLKEADGKDGNKGVVRVLVNGVESVASDEVLESCSGQFL